MPWTSQKSVWNVLEICLEHLGYGRQVPKSLMKSSAQRGRFLGVPKSLMKSAAQGGRFLGVPKSLKCWNGGYKIFYGRDGSLCNIGGKPFHRSDKNETSLSWISQMICFLVRPLLLVILFHRLDPFGWWASSKMANDFRFGRYLAIRILLQREFGLVMVLHICFTVRALFITSNFLNPRPPTHFGLAIFDQGRKCHFFTDWVLSYRKLLRILLISSITFLGAISKECI